MEKSRPNGWRLALRAGCLAAVAALPVPVGQVLAQGVSTPDVAVTTLNGQHDFDFELGTWTMHRRRLQHPLSGSTTWLSAGPAEHIVRTIWGGRAFLAELRVDSPTPHFVGSILHLHDPQSHQWYLYWASSEDGKVAAPMVGAFRKGRGEFIDQEPFHGVMILVRVVYSAITPTSFRTEQSFSADGGVTWEVNAVDTFTRRKG